MILLFLPLIIAKNIENVNLLRVKLENYSVFFFVLQKYGRHLIGHKFFTIEDTYNEEPDEVFVPS